MMERLKLGIGCTWAACLENTIALHRQAMPAAERQMIYGEEIDNAS